MEEAESMPVAIATGRADGHSLLEMVKNREGQFDSDHDKLLWWASFMGYLGGMCAGSLGVDALQAIESMTKKLTSQILKERSH